MSEAATAENIEQTAELEPVEQTPAKAVAPGINRFGLQAEHNQLWRLNVPIEVTPEQCMDEGFWAHIAAHLRPGDEIRVFPDSMVWELVLHVIGAGKAYAHVAQKAFYNLSPREDQVALPSIYTVDFAGTTHKWRVIREGKVLKDGIQTEGLARRAAAQHEAAVNR